MWLRLDFSLNCPLFSALITRTVCTERFKRSSQISETSPLYLHELGHVPDADLAPLGGGGEKVRAAAEAVAGDLIGAVGAGELGGAGGQSDGQRNVLGVFSLDERAVGRVALVLRPENTWVFRTLECFGFTVSVSVCLNPHHGSSVGSQQTRHTLQVKHMARSSPVDAGCPGGQRKGEKTFH